MMPTEREERICYEQLELRYNPNDSTDGWEIWVDGERRCRDDSPRAVFEQWAARDDYEGRYTDRDGEPLHEQRPDDYERREVSALSPMDIELIPSEDVQLRLWSTLKAREKNGDPLFLPNFCDEEGLDLNEAKRAVQLFADEWLVEWGVSIHSIWLTPDGEECDCPEWLQKSLNHREGM